MPADTKNKHTLLPGTVHDPPGIRVAGGGDDAQDSSEFSPDATVSDTCLIRHSGI